MTTNPGLRWSVTGWLVGALLTGLLLDVSQYLILYSGDAEWSGGFVHFVVTGFIPYFFFGAIGLGVARLAASRLNRKANVVVAGLLFAALPPVLEVVLVLHFRLGDPLAAVLRLEMLVSSALFFISGSAGAAVDVRLTTVRTAAPLASGATEQPR